MRAKVVIAFNSTTNENGYMVMIQESKGKKYNKGLLVKGEAFYTTNKKEANKIVKEFNNNI